ncbi:hypothetical protein GM418_15240 [Maribellus comscasis]|uniref:Lipoprotein n=1 Tax=Maribellus comscasis TaxID=2681766 RepID=A0A6I6JPS9_9BACT|nr:hypothetical protein [Maribellus comscasis]QGY44976.1 hypothetical protein GM418_15240 [Maribellus comscasis]
MNNYRNYFSSLGLAILSAIVLFACDKDDDDVIEENENKTGVQVVANGNLGNILTDQKNQSLYFFAGDVGGVSSCNGGCATTWPPFTGDVYNLELSSSLDRSDFNTITREDGQEQLTFKGWPLYYFSPEADGVLEAPGETSGEGRGGVFHIAKPDYTVLVGSQAVSEGEEPLLYLVDDKGVSLYHSINDDENFSNCAGGCAEVWPPFDPSGNIVVPSTLNINDFNTIYREDDLGNQLTTQGSPLYYFSPDEQVPGNVLGQGGANETFFVVEQPQ